MNGLINKSNTTIMKLRIFKTKSGEFRWHMISKGRIIAESGESYKNKKDMLKSLKSVSDFFKPAIKMLIDDEVNKRGRYRMPTTPEPDGTITVMTFL